MKFWANVYLGKEAYFEYQGHRSKARLRGFLRAKAVIAFSAS